MFIARTQLIYHKFSKSISQSYLQTTKNFLQTTRSIQLQRPMSATILPQKRAYSETKMSPLGTVKASIAACRIAPAFEEGKEDSTIGTHNGHFHCDEALAIGLLKVLPEFAPMAVLRTRTNDLLDKCNIVVDVGGSFDVKKRRFDHHQRGFEETFDEEHTQTKLSSAGLVYKYYGKQIVAEIAKQLEVDLDGQLIYVGFVEHVDAIDNGVSPIVDGFKVPTTLSARVGNLNPAWNEESSVDHEMEQFRKAVDLTTTEFVENVQGLLMNWLPARHIVETALKGRDAVHPSGQVLYLEKSCPWKGHLDDLEKEQELGDTIKYVIYEDSNGAWRIQCVSVEPGSFENRLSLPKEYCGLRDDELSKACGITGCIFIHANGFIGANQTREGVLAMASLALDKQ